MNALNALVLLLIVGLMMSYATGMIWGSISGKSVETANKLVTWELKQLTKFGRWMLKTTFQLISDLFGHLAKAMNPPKKKKKP